MKGDSTGHFTFLATLAGTVDERRQHRTLYIPGYTSRNSWWKETAQDTLHSWLHLQEQLMKGDSTGHFTFLATLAGTVDERRQHRTLYIPGYTCRNSWWKETAQDTLHSWLHLQEQLMKGDGTGHFIFLATLAGTVDERRRHRTLYIPGYTCRNSWCKETAQDTLHSWLHLQEQLMKGDCTGHFTFLATLAGTVDERRRHRTLYIPGYTCRNSWCKETAQDTLHSWLLYLQEQLMKGDGTRQFTFLATLAGTVDERRRHKTLYIPGYTSRNSWCKETAQDTLHSWLHLQEQLMQGDCTGHFTFLATIAGTVDVRRRHRTLYIPGYTCRNSWCKETAQDTLHSWLHLQEQLMQGDCTGHFTFLATLAGTVDARRLHRTLYIPGYNCRNSWCKETAQDPLHSWLHLQEQLMQGDGTGHFTFLATLAGTVDERRRHRTLYIPGYTCRNSWWKETAQDTLHSWLHLQEQLMKGDGTGHFTFLATLAGTVDARRRHRTLYIPGYTCRNSWCKETAQDTLHSLLHLQEQLMKGDGTGHFTFLATLAGTVDERRRHRTLYIPGYTCRNSWWKETAQDTLHSWLHLQEQLMKGDGTGHFTFLATLAGTVDERRLHRTLYIPGYTCRKSWWKETAQDTLIFITSWQR